MTMKELIVIIPWFFISAATVVELNGDAAVSPVSFGEAYYAGGPAYAAIPQLAAVSQVKFDHPRYAFGYSVQDFTTGDHKYAKEVREGEVVKGTYSLADADGTQRTVNYYADPIHGFNAVVHKTQVLR